LRKIQITTKGIKKSLKRYNYLQAISEYIWNGFDARASVVRIKFTTNDLNGIDKITITDNGDGINLNELESKFTPFWESEKQIDPSKRLRMISAVHGKNGIGRLTFHRFCLESEWITTYQDEFQLATYSIDIKAGTLDSYNISDLSYSQKETGTIVELKNIFEDISKKDLSDFLCQEFGWFLELNAFKKYALYFDGELLDYTYIVGEKESFKLKAPQGNEFEVKYIRWEQRMINEYSRFYYLNSEHVEVNKQTTSLNNKGDSFFHSIYIQGKLFDKFYFNQEEHGDQQYFSLNQGKSDEDYQYLMQEVNRYLRDKRKPFLKSYTDIVIKDLQVSKAFPMFNDNPWDNIRKDELEQMVRELYQVEPKIFSKMNTEQKKTFVRFLDLIMDSGERNRLFDVLNEIVELDNSEREELAELLKSTRMSSIIKTIRLIKDRYIAIDELKQIVYSKELMGNERDHIQIFIENHYWIFGEQYNLVTAAEPKFEEALRRYIHLLTGEKIAGKIDHPDKRREMDIFMVRWDKGVDSINNIVVELKHPTITLGQKEFDQVRKYLDVIMKEDQFNARNMKWEFILVGNDVDDYIEGLYESAQPHGEKFLAFKRLAYKVYVKRWSDIFTEFEIKHSFIDEKLQLERSKLSKEYGHANEILSQMTENTAILAKQYKISNTN
jgi:hypothetical protein